MNKFRQILTSSGNQGLYEKRAERVGSGVENALTSRIQKVQQEKDKIEDEIEEMLDLGRDNSMSLEPKRPESYDEFVAKWEDLEITKDQLDIQLTALNRIKENYFTVVSSSEKGE